MATKVLGNDSESTITLVLFYIFNDNVIILHVRHTEIVEREWLAPREGWAYPGGKIPVNADINLERTSGGTVEKRQRSRRPTLESGRGPTETPQSTIADMAVLFDAHPPNLVKLLRGLNRSLGSSSKLVHLLAQEFMDL